MTTCPKCQTPNRPGVRFCRRCGEALPSESDSRAGTPSSQSKSVSGSFSQFGQPSGALCPNCGAQLRPGARFCKACGKPVAPFGTSPDRSLCPRCGAELRAGARFCKQCGSRVSGPLTSASQAGQPHMQAPWTAASGGWLKPGTGDLLPMQILSNRYMVMEKIAEGGMGAIYQAQDRRLQARVVAIKEMNALAIPETERQRVLASFAQEAELLARLDHPNLVRVTDRFQEGERHYMVMEFIEGETLETIMEARTAPFTEGEVLAWAEQLCDVLAYLHNQDPPIIYRDIKPSNIMLVAGDPDNTLKLIDFGIARFYKPGKRKDTIQFGTEGYAPPEQYGQTQTDERADVFALGAMLHQMLTLRDPSSELWNFPPLRKLSPAVGKRVEAAIAKAVAMKKESRHQNMAAMWEALSGRKPSWTHLSVRLVSLPGDVDLAAEAAMPSEAIVSTRSALSFDRVITGQGPSELRREIEITYGCEVSVTTGAPWLEVVPDRLDAQGGKVAVVLKTEGLCTERLRLRGGLIKRWAGLHTARLVPAAREYQSFIAFHQSGGLREEQQVSVVVSPDPWQVGAGWVLTVVAMLVELSVVVGITLVFLANAGVIYL
ncbi:MAG: protein kinase [Anaerolineae bacterium]|nr:protein kinase [Anaerolineae bacterium]